MNDVTTVVNNDVGVVSVLDRKEITDKRVTSKAFNKTLLSFLKVLFKHYLKDVKKALFVVDPLQAIDRRRVRNILDKR